MMKHIQGQRMNKKIKLIIWFDNGWGYAARIVDTVKKLGQVL